LKGKIQKPVKSVLDASRTYVSKLKEYKKLREALNWTFDKKPLKKEVKIC